MKKHTPNEVRALMQQAEVLEQQGLAQAEICSNLGISVMTYHRWRRRIFLPQLDRQPVAPIESASISPMTRPPQLPIADLRHLRDLERENQQLRKIVADLMLERLQILEGGARTAGHHKLALTAGSGQT
jgi:putative transposase